MCPRGHSLVTVTIQTSLSLSPAHLSSHGHSPQVPGAGSPPSVFPPVQSSGWALGNLCWVGSFPPLEPSAKQLLSSWQWVLETKLDVELPFHFYTLFMCSKWAHQVQAGFWNGVWGSSNSKVPRSHPHHQGRAGVTLTALSSCSSPQSMVWEAQKCHKNGND